MKMTPRRRVVVVLLLFTPLAYLYVYLDLFTALNLARWYRDGYATCDGSWRSYFNTCSRGYNTGLAWLLLAVTTAALIAAGFGLGYWVMAPLRTVSESVRRFGPTSIGLRLRPDGPRDELRELSEAIDDVLDRLAEGYEAQQRFASNASHELRTPLATQRALIEISLSSSLTPEQLELLSRQLLATNERNERLIDGLLTLAETERGLLTRTPVRLDPLVTECITTQQPVAADRSITIEADLQPCTVIGEIALLERLVANLLQNAVKYSDPGGRVTVGLRADGTLLVTNGGPRVPADQVPALFEPFRRMSGERLDHGGGVGLGLTIARTIVAAHGGSISAVANPNGGLTLTVQLPTS